MPEATSNHTTVPTRRRFLSQGAAVAAGASALALAVIPPVSAAAAPMAAMAPSEVDPIFALIEEWRSTAKAVAAAATEVSRREDRLIEEGLGEYAVICVLDATCRHGKPKQTMIYTHDQIDRHLPPDRFGKANADARAALDAKIEQHKEIMGDSESVLYAAQDAETEAVDMLVWTPPTTVAGTLALLELWPELRRARIDDDQAGAIMISVIDALRDLHPNVAAIDAAAVPS